jgi:hypothetical protein
VCRGAIACLVAAAFGGPAEAVERIRLEAEGREYAVAGELVLETEEGGVVVLAPDGVLWTVPPASLLERATDDEPFVPLAAEALAQQLRLELPEGFDFHHTAHYLIAYNTTREYAQWCGALFERLHRAFTNFWTRRGFELTEPRFPLVAVVFADGRSYRDFAQPELGEGADSIVGYYSLRTNRMTTYDLTGIEALRDSGDRRGSQAQINAMLSRPEAAFGVATVIHEATHQIAFNCGLQQRFADVPLWLLEGMAVYFETPDLKSAKGWRTIGAVNHGRLDRFRDYATQRPPRSLESLLMTDERLRDPRQSTDAYAEAWALHYFLLRTRPKQYDEYLRLQMSKTPFVTDDPEQRVAEFRQCFDGDLAELDAEFLRYVDRIR